MRMAYSKEMTVEESIDIEFSDIKIECEVTVRFSIN